MTDKNQTAMQKMQEIANRLISNTPQLVKMLDNDSLLKPTNKRPGSPSHSKKGRVPQGVNYAKTEMTSNDYHEKCKELTTELMNEKDRVSQLQEEVNIIKQRFVEREIQYRKIIEELQDEIKSKSVLDTNDRNRMQNIQELHSEIINNISSIQNKTSKILIEQESDIRRFFHKKINEIKDKFKEDKINKTEKDHEYQQKEKQMMSELEWIKNIAHKIDSENQSMLKKYTTLKSEFDIQEKDKDILLKELLMKKKENAVLNSQVQKYEKLLNEVSKEMESEEQERSLASDNPQNSFSNQKKKSSVSNLMNSRVSNGQKDSRVIKDKDSRVSNSNNLSQHVNQKRLENTVSHLKSIIAKEQKKVRDLKNLYMKEIGSKSELETIIRKLVDDVRESVIEIEKERKRKKGNQDQFTVEAREELLEKLLSNEKVLTLIYDKTFYSAGNNRGTLGLGAYEEIPEEIQQIIEDDAENEEGFYQS